jgi:uncharacterized protein with PIN domain
MKILYVKEDCEICEEALEHISYREVIFIEENYNKKIYDTYDCTEDKKKGRKISLKIPFELIPAVPALHNTEMNVTIIGGSAVIPILAGTKKLREVLRGAVIRCNRCKRQMFFHSTQLCGKCRKIYENQGKK